MQLIRANSPDTAAMLLDAWGRGDMTAVSAYLNTSDAAAGLNGCSSLEAERRDLLSGIALALRPCIGARAASAEAEACLQLLRHLAKSTPA